MFGSLAIIALSLFTARETEGENWEYLDVTYSYELNCPSTGPIAGLLATYCLAGRDKHCWPTPEETCRSLGL